MGLEKFIYVHFVWNIYNFYCLLLTIYFIKEFNQNDNSITDTSSCSISTQQLQTSNSTSAFLRNTFCPTVVGGKRAYCNYSKDSFDSSYYNYEPTINEQEQKNKSQTLNADDLTLLNNNKNANLVCFLLCIKILGNKVS